MFYKKRKTFKLQKSQYTCKRINHYKEQAKGEEKCSYFTAKFPYIFMHLDDDYSSNELFSLSFEVNFFQQSRICSLNSTISEKKPSMFISGTPFCFLPSSLPSCCLISGLLSCLHIHSSYLSFLSLSLSLSIFLHSHENLNTSSV